MPSLARQTRDVTSTRLELHASDIHTLSNDNFTPRSPARVPYPLPFIRAD